ncbi:MAG: GGDEF domain-containing protein, partial [Pseudomonadota bacterium]|nr:GGDEF domain-containing protein [Pseudomonadota bacterium]
MSLRSRLTRLVFGIDPQVRRLLRYWAATGILYLVCMVTMWVQIHNGTADREAGTFLYWFGASAVLGFYALIRASKVLGLLPWQLAMLQAVVALGCNIAAYSMTGPIRGASLMLLLVVIVFCTFSLRARQTMAIGALAIGALGATM